MKKKAISKILVMPSDGLYCGCKRCVFNDGGFSCKSEPCYNYNGGHSYFVNDEDFKESK